MSDIHVRHFEHRARIRGAPAGARERIDRALAQMLDEGLESALLHAGVDTDEQICIRRFVARTQLDLSRSDLQLTADWSNAWVDALRAILQGGGDNVLRYRSRLHVLVDIALGVLRGEDSRAWAWRQLGAWPAIAPRSPEAAVELARILARHSFAALPVCVVLAQARLLGRWIARLPRAELQGLARAALRAADVDAGMLDLARAHVADGADLFAARIAATLAASPLHAQLAPLVDADNVAVLATLVLLAAEPAALRAADAPGLLAVAARALRDPQRRRIEPAPGGPAVGAQAGQPDATAVVARPASTPAALATRRTRSRLGQAAAPEAGPAESIAMDGPPAAHPVRAEAEAHEKESSAALRERAHTGFGGLMFLLWLIEPSGVLAAVEADRPLAARGLRWVLRQIALQILPLDADDPVLNAFTGTTPGARPAAEIDAEAPAPAEIADIALLTLRMVELLRERLAEPAQPQQLLLEAVCHRHADMHFEPGWIELHFRLDAASTSVRRAGLDRDPGWVPWLGTVVKFAYV